MLGSSSEIKWTIPDCDLIENDAGMVSKKSLKKSNLGNYFWWNIYGALAKNLKILSLSSVESQQYAYSNGPSVGLSVLPKTETWPTFLSF